MLEEKVFFWKETESGFNIRWNNYTYLHDGYVFVSDLKKHYERRWSSGGLDRTKYASESYHFLPNTIKTKIAYPKSADRKKMAGLFDQQADIYLDAGPTYPFQWYSMLVARTLHHSLAWDVGTGNGQAAIGVSTISYI